ncbi:sulfur carrier protein ThiS [Alkalicoccobacillus gibsonii]|jgi:sulfur carrier protein|uniref:Sulfur carrier protein ThiS n=1 Tax=Alkalicoccobacillus gibsonii TaxID=79881 RepID=A0ABU9VGX4_9BACI
MNINVNGQSISFEGQTLEDLVIQYKLEPELIVTEVDGEIISREERGAKQLQDGMKIELVHFVGGG